MSTFANLRKGDRVRLVELLTNEPGEGTVVMPIVAFLLSVWQHSPMPSTKAPSVEPENGPICTCRWLPCAWNPSLGQVVARIPVAGCTEQKELWADSVDAWHSRLNDIPVEPFADRWWRS